MRGSFNNRYIRFRYYTDMAQTLCIKCGSELKASSYCQLCQQPLIFACPSCEYITDEKVHPDCRNAEILAKTDTTTTQEGSTIITTASTTPRPRSTTGNQQQSSTVNKSKEEISKTEQSSVPSYMTTEQDNDKNSNINPFTAGTAAWQSLVTYWMYNYGEFLENALKMTEEWCTVFWRPWVNWMPKKGRQNRTE
jgi:hypothetical protein